MFMVHVQTHAEFDGDEDEVIDYESWTDVLVDYQTDDAELPDFTDDIEFPFTCMDGTSEIVIHKVDDEDIDPCDDTDDGDGWADDTDDGGWSQFDTNSRSSGPQY